MSTTTAAFGIVSCAWLSHTNHGLIPCSTLCAPKERLCDFHQKVYRFHKLHRQYTFLAKRFEYLLLEEYRILHQCKQMNDIRIAYNDFDKSVWVYNELEVACDMPHILYTVDTRFLCMMSDFIYRHYRPCPFIYLTMMISDNVDDYPNHTFIENIDDVEPFVEHIERVYKEFEQNVYERKQELEFVMRETPFDPETTPICVAIDKYLKAHDGHFPSTQ